jgi:hypothetical protein
MNLSEDHRKRRFVGPELRWLSRTDTDCLILASTSILIDTLVPLQENSAEFARRYEAAGAGKSVKLVVAKDQGHNDWEGFFRSQELVDFAIDHARDGAKIAAEP